MDKEYAGLKEFALFWGADLFGVADISGSEEIYGESPSIKIRLPRAVCLGAALSSAVLGEIERHPTKLYFHHYRSVNILLDQLSLRICRYLENKGRRAVPIPASQIVDWEKQRGHLSHKSVAAAAGLGWIGRNNLLVTKKFGSRVRLATVLTDMLLPVDGPGGEGCGSCRACVSLCPAGAIKESPAEFDHIKCFEKLKEFQKARLADQYICGICVRHCKGAGEARDCAIQGTVNR